MMGQGIADAYARAGEIEGRGMQALGQGIAQGITSAASSVAGYVKEQKQIESQNKAYDNLFKNPLVQNMFFQDKQGPEGVITAKDQAFQFLAQTADMKPSEKNMFYNTVVPPAIGQYYKMQQIEAEQKGLFNRVIAGKKAVPNTTDFSPGLTQAVSDQQPSQTAPKTAAPMPGSELDFEKAMSTLEKHMVKKYGPDYRLRKIQATQQDMEEAGLQ